MQCSIASGRGGGVAKAKPKPKSAPLSQMALAGKTLDEKVSLARACLGVF